MDTTHETNTTHMRLYNDQNGRLYLNAQERNRFFDAANAQPLHIRLFCLTLLYTGCRLSEARELTTHSLQAEAQLLAVRSLKKRDQHHMREIPIPISSVQSLNNYAARAERVLQSAKLERTKNQSNKTSSVQTEKVPPSRPDWLWINEMGDKINRITAYRWITMVMDEARIYPKRCQRNRCFMRCV